MAMTDAQLLEQFAGARDETAFEALLARHGPMVWGVCLRTLGHRQEAEDAFQATFLVLARRAAAIRRREAVGGWLHAVAHRLALKVKLADRTRREREIAAGDQAAAVRTPDDLMTQVVWRELRSVLDEELHRLPEKYRVPLVLCYLEGKTHLEAAQELGWPSGSMSKRLERACELLRERLTRRGLAFSAALVAGALAVHGASAVPPTLASTTMRGAMAYLTGKAAGVVTAPVIALTEGVLLTMLMSKIKIAAAVLLALGLGAGLATYGVTAGGQQPIPGTVEVPANPPANVKPFDQVAIPAKDQGNRFVQAVIDPQPKHTLTLPAAYGCVIELRAKPTKWEISSTCVDLRPIGKTNRYILRTRQHGSAVCHFWFADKAKWNFSEDLFSLLIRVDGWPDIAAPVDPAITKDIPLIKTFTPPEGSLDIVAGRARLLVLKEGLWHHELLYKEQFFATKAVSPMQLLLTAGQVVNARDVLTLWYPANPDDDQLQAVNYLVRVVPEGAASAPPPASGTKNQPPPVAKGPSMNELAKAKREAAKDALDISLKALEAGRDLQPCLKASRRLMEADLEMGITQADRIKAYETYLNQVRELDDLAKKRHSGGYNLDIYETKYLLAEAELWLAKEKAKQ